MDTHSQHHPEPQHPSPSAEQATAADQYYRQGNDHRRRGNWQQAINCYLEAIALDPTSPAVEAKQMLDDILAFYHKDSYNP